MGFPARRLGLVIALVLVPVLASAQGAGPSPASNAPPPGGGNVGTPQSGNAGGAVSGTVNAGEKPAADTAKSSNNVGGVSFNDKPARRAPVGRVLPRRAGSLATFPGFEQLPDGGSRLFVQLSQNVPVEERKATGSVTYVLRGAHLRVNNDANSLITVHFNTPVFRARLVPQGNDLHFVLELRSAAAPAFKVQQNADKSSTLQIDFAKGDFISGDGRESLPPEPGSRGNGKRGARGAQPGRAAAPGTQTPPPADSPDQGPTP